MLFPDDLAGSITTLVTNPIWTVQTAQSTRAVTVYEDGSGDLKKVKPSAIEAASEIIKKDGVKGLWRGIGPALILVINPIIQASLPQRIQPDGAE
jgi:adenine nucleotide transporter 17